MMCVAVDQTAFCLARPPETRAKAAQPVTAETALIVTESTYAVNDCLNTGLGKALA